MVFTLKTSVCFVVIRIVLVLPVHPGINQGTGDLFQTFFDPLPLYARPRFWSGEISPGAGRPVGWRESLPPAQQKGLDGAADGRDDHNRRQQHPRRGPGDGGRGEIEGI